MADADTPKASTDTVTKILLGVIAAGIWVLVALHVGTARKVDAIAAEVVAIGADTEAIHQDIDPGAADDEEEAADHATSWRAPHGESRVHGAGFRAKR